MNKCFNLLFMLTSCFSATIALGMPQLGTTHSGKSLGEIAKEVTRSFPPEGSPPIGVIDASAREYPSYQSMDAWLTALEADEKTLKSQLVRIENEMKTLKQFTEHQKALNLRWIDPKKEAVFGNKFEVNIGNGKKQQICQATFQQGTHPGVLTEGGCLITYGWDALVMPFYHILVGNIKTHWAKVNPQDLIQYQLIERNPDSPVWKEKFIPILGGFSDTPNYAKNTPLFICKAVYNHQTYIGKVVSNFCNVAVGPREEAVAEYEVLFGSK